MECNVSASGNELTVAISGRIDAPSAPMLEETVSKVAGNAEKLILDFTNTEYITSAGLRVLLGAQKHMDRKNGSMVIINVSDDVMRVFKETKFSDFLTIE